jgi:hypothetical protein
LEELGCKLPSYVKKSTCKDMCYVAAWSLANWRDAVPEALTKSSHGKSRPDKAQRKAKGSRDLWFDIGANQSSGSPARRGISACCSTTLVSGTSATNGVLAAQRGAQRDGCTFDTAATRDEFAKHFRGKAMALHWRRWCDGRGRLQRAYDGTEEEGSIAKL